MQERSRSGGMAHLGSMCEEAVRPFVAEVVEGMRPCVRGCGAMVPIGRFVCEACDAEVAAHAHRRLAEQRQAKALDALSGFNDVCMVRALRRSPSAADPGFPRDEWSADALAAARWWKPGSEEGFWLGGRVGSGKSTIAKGFAKRLIDEGHTAVVVNVAAMVETLHHLAWSDKERHKHLPLRNALGAVDVLILDDFWTRKLTRPEVAELFGVLDLRWNSPLPLPVVVTANASKRETRSTMLAAYASDAEQRDEVERIYDRAAGLSGPEVPCFYPGSRRTGIDDAQVPFVRSLIASWRQAA